MNGMYIHIPFCKQACHYCNFHFSTQLRYRSEMVDAICKEIELTNRFFDINLLNTIYFGGGTPSLLNEKDFIRIFSAINASYILNPGYEVTLEANPDDITENFLSFLKNHTPVNRLSIGIQSFYDEHLKLMNRSHNAFQAKTCIQMADKFGFNNITIDLIYGLPYGPSNYWENNLDTFLQMQLPHLSAYCLTVEPKTVLNYKVKKGKIHLPDDNQTYDEFSLLRKKLHSGGFNQYEISNFSKPGFEALHNSGYWKDMQYLGIGPSAHSYKKGMRRWNINSNQKYIKSISKYELNFAEEILNENDIYNEFLMTQLRKTNGIDLTEMTKKFGVSKKEFLLESSKQFIANKDLIQIDDKLFLSEKGLFLSDNIISSLFLTN